MEPDPVVRVQVQEERRRVLRLAVLPEAPRYAAWSLFRLGVLAWLGEDGAEARRAWQGAEKVWSTPEVYGENSTHPHWVALQWCLQHAKDGATAVRENGASTKGTNSSRTEAAVMESPSLRHRGFTLDSKLPVFDTGP